METDIKNKIKIIDSNIEYMNLLIRYKLSTIYDYAFDIDDEEKKKIDNYVNAEVPREINNYKIIEYNGKVAGAYLVTNYQDGKLIDEIYIEEEYRNKGIGGYIIDGIISNEKIVYLYVYKENKRAIKLYKKIGFVVSQDTDIRYLMKYERMNKMKVLLFTHEQDIDGMGNVILCRKAFEEFDYVTCKTFEVNKNVLEKINDGTIYNYDYIFVTDVCIKEPVLKQIDNDEKLKNKIVVLDHHKSEIEEGNDKYDWVNIIIEKDGNKCSGTSLFYEYLINNGYLEHNDTLDEMVELTRQYDTWDWKKYNNYKARKLHIIFEVLGYSKYIEIMNRIVDEDNGVNFNSDEVDVIEKFDKDLELEISKILEGMKLYEVEIEGKVYKIGYVRCFYKYRNDINEIVIKDNNYDIDVVGMIMLDTETVSYRLVKDIDASKIAVYFGGKGHKAASSNPQDNERFKDVMKMFIGEDDE